MRKVVWRTNGKVEGGEGSIHGSDAKLDYNDLLGYAVAVLGISRNDFDWMTPVEFQSCMKARNDSIEDQVHLEYERSRFEAWLILSPHIKRDTEAKDLVEFPWEKKEIKKGRVINGKTNTISEVKSTIRRGKQKA